LSGLAGLFRRGAVLMAWITVRANMPVEGETGSCNISRVLMGTARA
jgi:hypothetical protein